MSEQEQPEKDAREERSELRLFEVAAIGCHEAAHKKLAEYLREKCNGVETFLFVEYFCKRPIPLKVAASENEYRKQKVFFPFIRRLVDLNQFIWIWDKESNGGKSEFVLQPKDRSLLRSFQNIKRYQLSFSDLQMGGKALEKWRENKTLDIREASYTQLESAGLITDYHAKKWEEYLEFIRTKTNETARQSLLQEYGLTVMPWKTGNQPSTTLFCFPVATPSIFYGYFILILSLPNDDKKRTIATGIWSELANLANEIYIPVLILIAESLLERRFTKRVREALDSAGGGTWKTLVRDFISEKEIPFLACAGNCSPGDGQQCLCCGEEPKAEHLPRKCNHSRCPQKDRTYEAAFCLPLHRLWLRRQALLEGGQITDDAEGAWKFLATLPLDKYFVASPGLIEQVRKVMQSKLEVPTDRGSLPAALVYGSPGSGKDVLARLIPLFSPDYFFGDIHTVNMAAIRPDALAGPMIQGLRVDLPSIQGMDGMLVQAKSPPKGNADGEEMYATFILDEMNSLDVDLQGILLRILEQGEVVPLFSIEKSYVKHLIVAIVNENPEEITRESDLRDLLSNQGKIGTLIGALLHETLRRTRRLREDLYHRLKRQLYVKVPDLNDRPEDIPMFFYVSAEKEAKKENRELAVDIEAYRTLMDPRISWQGNVRQVQAVAKLAIDEAKDQAKKDQSSADPELVISPSILLKAIEKYKS